MLKAIAERLPHENLLYLGDTARVPYGTRSRDTIARYTLNAAEALARMGVKMLVIACNTATAAALPEVMQRFAPIPVLGVIEPGAAAAVEASRNGHIGVIATEATINGHAYQKAIARLDPGALVTARACTLLVPLAEEGWLSGPITEGIIARYLQAMFSEAQPIAPDTLLLGCTHFPLFREALQKIAGSGIRIVDSGTTTAMAAQKKLEELDLKNPQEAAGAICFYTTDHKSRFARTGSLFLQKNLREEEITLIDL